MGELQLKQLEPTTDALVNDLRMTVLDNAIDFCSRMSLIQKSLAAKYQEKSELLAGLDPDGVDTALQIEDLRRKAEAAGIEARELESKLNVALGERVRLVRANGAPPAPPEQEAIEDDEERGIDWVTVGVMLVMVAMFVLYTYSGGVF